jgi:outer membrane protein OmpA-like peptidoglycan-associated protein
MAYIVKYYRGIVHAQFETGKTNHIYAHMNTADVELQPRFVLEGAQEIDIVSYEAATLNPAKPYLQHKINEGIELVFGVGLAKRVALKELTLQWTDEDVEHQRVWTFMAEKNGRRHGRLKANGFVAVVEEIPDIIKDVVPDSLSTVNNVQTSPVVEGDTNPRMNDNGSVQSSIHVPTISAAPTLSLMSRGGCSPFRGLGGGMPGGCGRRGCGFLAIIPMLFVLLGMLRQCQEGGRSTGRATIIHDTVYVDRVEERLDTLTLFKTDTIQMVDSSKQTVFKPVVLPNVQFYTNSANLIPTSLSDIQQLAQHLIDTPELDAIVIGHTDNVGDVQSNLKLSQRRAETVRNVIISMGVEANRLTAIGKGDKEPKADNSTEEGRLMNRRVEVQLVQTVINESKTTLKQ